MQCFNAYSDMRLQIASLYIAGATPFELYWNNGIVNLVDSCFVFLGELNLIGDH